MTAVWRLTGELPRLRDVRVSSLLEIALGGWLLSGVRSRAACAVSGALFILFSAFHVILLTDPVARPCGCFGGAWPALLGYHPPATVEAALAVLPAFLLLNAWWMLGEGEARASGTWRTLGAGLALAAAAVVMARVGRELGPLPREGHRALLGEFLPVPGIREGVRTLVVDEVRGQLGRFPVPVKDPDGLLDLLGRLVEAQSSASFERYAALMQSRGAAPRIPPEALQEAWDRGEARRPERWEGIAPDRILARRAAGGDLDVPPAGSGRMRAGFEGREFGRVFSTPFFVEVEEGPGTAGTVVDEIYVDVPVVTGGVRALCRYALALRTSGRWEFRAWAVMHTERRGRIAFLM